jgi:hypothetical protein
MRWRNMYYMTGLPGWMRFGFSPGWAGRSASGMGPCAEYLMSGQWPTPQMQAAWQAMQAAGTAAPDSQPPVAPFGPFGAPPDPQVQLQFLKSQAEMLSQQLEQVIEQIEGLGNEA